MTGKKEVSHPFFKKGLKENTGNYLPVNVISICCKIMEQNLLEVMSKHMENKEVIRNSQYGFIEGKLCLMTLVAFYNEVTAFVDKGSH